MLLQQIWKVTAAVALLTLLSAVAWGQQQQASPWKDRAEYDLFDSIVKTAQARDWAKVLQLLNTWKEKYAQTNFEKERLLLFAQAYQGAGQAQNMYDSALALLKVDPKNVQGLFYIVSLTTSMGKTDAAFLANGEKYAKALLAELASMAKPPNISDADFQKQKSGLEVTAYTTLGWAAMTQKNNADAEKHYRQVLKLNPNNGQASYWLGTVIIAQRDPEKQSEAFFHFARAASYTGDGAMTESGRKQVDSYLRKIYTALHGDESGMDEMITLAKGSAFPPAGFRVKSKQEIEHEKEEQLKKENPKLALWLSVKKQLIAPGGLEYFNSQVRNTNMPELRGYLVSQSPEQRPDTLVLGIEDRGSREVTLKLEQAFKYPAGRGTALNFSCIPQQFTPDPFNVTFDCVQDNVNGWPPPPQRRPAR